MTKAEIRKEIQELSKNVKITVLPAQETPKQITAFVRLQWGNKNGCRVNGSRLGSREGRVINA